jgi:hypothetical protein
MDRFCEWLGVDARGLQIIIDQHRNPRCWTQTSPGRWARVPDDAPGDDAAANAAPAPDFEANSALALDGEARYITVGKGYPT